jgi:hypothetical protein
MSTPSAPFISIHAKCSEVNTDTDRTLICRRSKDHGKLTSKYKREHFDPDADLYWSGEYGVYTAAQDHVRRAVAMGAAVSESVGSKGDGYPLKPAEDGEGHTFRYAGRTYWVGRPSKYTHSGVPQQWALRLIGPVGEYPFEEGATWSGRTRKAAVASMAADAYRELCPHEYHTGSDTCPGCDAYDQYESNS